MIGEPNMCISCMHYNSDDFEKFSCAAFPEGIPPMIIDGATKHSAPLPGQLNEIVFKPNHNSSSYETRKIKE